jgi:hypothetical protein
LKSQKRFGLKSLLALKKKKKYGCIFKTYF